MPDSTQKIEDRISEAISFKESNPNIKLTELAKQFHIPRQRLYQRILGRPSKIKHTPTNTRLSRAQETALCNYIDRLDRLNLSVRADLIRDAANRILLQSAPLGQTPTQVGLNWVTRFIRRYGYSTIPQKVLDRKRKASEDLDSVREYFSKLKVCIDEHAIVPADIWNMDETGFQIGVGKDQLVVTRRRKASYFALPINRESVTAVEAISAIGKHIPAFLILSGKIHMSQWYRICELPGDTCIGVSETGYSNDELSLQWIKHFDTHTTKLQEGVRRLLILDGYGSHHTIEFIKYADERNIILFALPPHSTHFLQPLDVCVFQPMKHYHALALDQIVREGCTNITKLEFLSFIQQVRIQALKTTTVIDAFKKTGIYPYNPEIVLYELKQRAGESLSQTTPPHNHSSSPFGTPLSIRKLHKVGNRLLDAVSKAQEDVEGLQTNLAEIQEGLERFIRGSEVQATELLQTKYDLGKTKLAEEVRRIRKQQKNHQLQSSGILTVADGRHMVAKIEKSAEQKAEEVLIAARTKRQKLAVKAGFEAAKLMRLYRRKGRFDPLYIIDSTGVGRRVRRG